ncbi:MAG: TauD/TfdA family dioxygenase [Alteromonadaceae bacterium]|nr:TauD/TfdA family dioxygenase [Alteromonadaceae bacterium]
MDIISIDTCNSSLDVQKTKSLLYQLSNSEIPIVFKNGMSKMNRQQWYDFLEQDCQLIPDKRHFDNTQSLKIQDWWEISYQPDKAETYAYSATRQPLHTDNAWFSNPAELNFFVMHKQAIEGGKQTIYPLSILMEDLQTKTPELLNDLTSIPVTIKKGEGAEEHITPIIKLGNSPTIFWNYYRTQKATPAIANMCQAFFDFLAEQENTSSVFRLPSDTGDCFVFNDAKLLHGREAFSARQSRDRVLYQSMWRLP